MRETRSPSASGWSWRTRTARPSRSARRTA
nr:MAG TPA: hypothetical protein [Caudoviricetes sp.]